MKNAIGSPLLSLTLVGCALSSSSGDPRLDGVWVSDKTKTLANIRAAEISADRIQFLRRNLGQLHMCFSGGRTAAYHSESHLGPNDVATYRVTESTPTSVTVKVDRGPVRTLHMEGECLHHLVPGWEYQEYFCRKSALKNPCA